MIHPARFRLALPFLILIVFASLPFHRAALASNPQQESYPPPILETVEPAPEQVIPQAATPLFYPPADADFNAVTPIPIGGQSGVQAPQGNLSNASNTTTTETSDRGLIFLWLGFIATLLIFGTSVVGSLLLFTRRNEN